MAKSKEDVNTKEIIKLSLKSIEDDLKSNEKEHKEFGKKMGTVEKAVIEMKTALIGFNGTPGALDEVGKNTKFRLEIKGALKLAYVLLFSSWLAIILQIFKVI